MNNAHSAVSEHGEPRLLAEPRKLPFSDGFKWFGDAFNLFAKNKFFWLVIASVDLLALAALQNVGDLLFDWLFGLQGLLFAGCVALAADMQERCEKLHYAELFSDFRCTLMPLLKLIALDFLMTLSATALAWALLSFFGIGSIEGVFNHEVMERLGTGQSLAAVGVILLFVLPVMMAVWLAPALICLHDVPVVQAMKMSFRSLLKNIKPALAYAFAWLSLLLLAGLSLIAMGTAAGQLFGGAGHSDTVSGLIVAVAACLAGLLNTVFLLGRYAAFRRIWRE